MILRLGTTHSLVRSPGILRAVMYFSFNLPSAKSRLKRLPHLAAVQRTSSILEGISQEIRNITEDRKHRAIRSRESNVCEWAGGIVTARVVNFSITCLAGGTAAGFPIDSAGMDLRKPAESYYSQAPEPTNPAQYQGWVLLPAARRASSSFRSAFHTASPVEA